MESQRLWPNLSQKLAIFSTMTNTDGLGDHEEPGNYIT